jgi:adenylate cyclase
MELSLTPQAFLPLFVCLECFTGNTLLSRQPNMRAKVIVIPANRESYDVEIGNTATIGRGRDNTVSFLDSQHVSRQHAIIRCHNACEFQLMDLGSRNGTFVDGRRVIMPVVLRHGSSIRIANNVVIFEQVEDADPGSTVDVTLAAGTDAGLDESAEVAIMVCDIRGFSTMSEILSEEILARTLGEWFRHAGNLVQARGGTIDKFIGDAILAYWTKFDDDGAEASAALDIARQLLVRAAEMRWPTPEAKPFHIAVALHYGPVTCGNIGLVAQRDATIIGDAVNTAFRLEGLMKQLNQRLVLSHDFLTRLAHPESDYSDLGEHQLKGKNQPVRIFAPKT